MSNGFSSIEDLMPPKPGAGTPAGPTGQPISDEAAEAEPAADDKTQAKLAEKMESIRLDTLEDETKARAQMTGVPYINLEAFPIGPEIISLLPEAEARAEKVIPFFRLENQIRLATVDIDNPKVDEIVKRMEQEHEGSKIQVYMISQHSFDNAVKLYKNVAKIKKVEYGVHITPEQLEAYKKELTDFSILNARLQSVNMTEAFAMIMAMALNVGTSDVHVEAEELKAVIKFRIDGILQEVANLNVEHLPRLVSRIKAIAGLKINITEIPQDGRITIELGTDDKLDLRVSTLPSAYGESIVFRLLKSSAVGLTFDELGMRAPAYARLKEQIEKPNGMIVTTGPTGSGKTTTLYAILKKVNTPENKVITLENPIEYRISGIVQSQIDHSKKYTFSMGLRALMRQDPDVVMVGEIRDLETAETAIQAALTGHLMLSTIHTNDAAGAVPRFLGMGVNPSLLAPALNAVIGQRLVRRICKDCKAEYTPPPEQVARMKEWFAELPANSGETPPPVEDVKFYKGKGCQVCGDSGYKGRVGIYEIFTMSAGIEKQILSGKASEFEMIKLLNEAGMVTMGQDGLLKVVDGLTTMDEVFRVAKR